MAWEAGQDPYRVYNGLDALYRQLALKHPCPACWPPGRLRTVCDLCHGRGFLWLPLDEPGPPLLPAFPTRLRAFNYGCAIALAEAKSGKKQRTASGDVRLEREQDRTEPE